MVMPGTIGVLALQGDWAAHIHFLAELGARGVALRRADELATVDALVLPGGESTAMLKLMESQGLAADIEQLVASGMPVLATCAGVILLARKVVPEQPCLGLLEVEVERNAYGRQLASAVVELRLAAALGEPPTMEGVFIRAPKIVACGERVEQLAWRGEDPVLVRQGQLLAATFHPELARDLRIHRLFLELLR
jgi:5'-phosphate synthase pdxT subunit